MHWVHLKLLKCIFSTRWEREILTRTGLMGVICGQSGGIPATGMISCFAQGAFPCLFLFLRSIVRSQAPSLPSDQIPFKWSSLNFWGPDLTDDWEAKSTQESTFTTDFTSGAPGSHLLNKTCALSVQTWYLLQWIQNQHIRDTPTTQVTPKKLTDKGKEMFVFNYVLL